jgi:hypothetical protein
VGSSYGILPGNNYQKTTLTIIYDVVKQDFRRKAKLEAEGHLVFDPLDHMVYLPTPSKEIA